MNRWGCLVVSSLVGALAVGCGGAGGGAEAVSGETEATAGSFQLKGQLRAPSFTSTTGASVYALTGAITKAVLNDADPTVDETEILSSVVRTGGTQITAFSLGDGSVRTVADGVSATKIRCTTTWVYCLSGTNLRRVPLAGGTPTTIKTNVTDFDLNSDGSKLIYRLSSPYGYYFSNGDGSGQTIINANPVQFDLIGGLNSTTCLAVNYSDSWLYSLNLSNGASYSPMFLLLQPAAVAWHAPSGTLVHRNTGSNDFEKYRVASTTVWGTGLAYPNTPAWTGPISVGPTGGRMVTSDGSERVRIDNISDGTSNTLLFEEASVGAVWWGPYIPQRQFVPSSTYGSGAAAVVFSEFGKKVPAVVLADCTTRGTMVATKVSVDGSTNVVYRLDCDQLTKLHYSKGGGFALQNIVTSGTGLKGAYVSIDAETGEAASVLTFTKRPTESRTPRGVRLVGEGLELIPLRGTATRRPAQSIEL